MWCGHCHQEVPAVRSGDRNALVCAHCSQDLKFVTPPVSDVGIALDEFESQQSAPVVICDAIEEFKLTDSREKLRRIGQQLRIPYVQPMQVNASPIWERKITSTPTSTHEPRAISQQENLTPSRNSSASFLLTCVLGLGVVGFLAGVGTLLFAMSFESTSLWQWGLSATIASEGILVIGLTWMAVRLWRNGYQLNSQIRGVDAQLQEIHQLTGTLAANQVSSSHHYYHHFSQVANPHMLVANLRGQIDQLAERIAV